MGYKSTVRVYGIVCCKFFSSASLHREFYNVSPSFSVFSNRAFFTSMYAFFISFLKNGQFLTVLLFIFRALLTGK